MKTIDSKKYVLEIMADGFTEREFLTELKIEIEIELKWNLKIKERNKTNCKGKG